MSQRVEAVLAADATTAAYPSFTLAQQLRMVAQLIRADLGIRIYFVELGGGGIGGFDNHANQRDNHAALLREMSASIAAFMSDLKRENLLSRVLLMTFSEFGRTVSENGRRGTDHGAAAPVFLVGGRVKGGFHGNTPQPDRPGSGRDSSSSSTTVASMPPCSSAGWDSTRVPSWGTNTMRWM